MAKPDIEKMKAKKDVEGLIKALKDKDALVRERAAEALFETGDLRAVDPLAEAIRDDEGVKTVAEETLVRLAIARAAGPPTKAPEDKEDKKVREAAKEPSAEVSEESPKPKKEEAVTTSGGIYDELRDIVSQYSDKIKHDKVFLAPDIPPKKLANAIKSFAKLKEGEQPLVLVDDSILGNAKSGLLLTDRWIYCHETWEKPQSLAIQDVSSIGFDQKWSGRTFHINGKKFWTVAQLGEKETMGLIELIKQMAAKLRPVKYAEKEKKEDKKAKVVKEDKKTKVVKENKKTEVVYKSPITSEISWVVRELQTLRADISGLATRYSKGGLAFGAGVGQARELIPMICRNIDQAINALKTGLDPYNRPITKSQVADGLQEMVGDVISPTSIGLLTGVLSSDGVRLLGEHLSYLNLLAKKIKEGEG